MAEMVTWPELVDDDGTLTTGSVVGHDFELAMKTSIEDQVHNTTYTAVKPKDITGEIEAIKASKAVGSWSSLQDACDGVIDFTDGSLILPASVVDTDTLKATLYGKNLVMNGNFSISGTENSFNGWEKVSGAGWALAGDRKVGTYAAQSTRAGTDCILRQAIIDDIPGLKLGALQGKKFGFGAWVYCGSANTAKVILYDGITDTELVHSGGGTWEWLSTVKQISYSATKLEISVEIQNNDVLAKFDGITVLQQDQAPDRWVPMLSRAGSVTFAFPGKLTIGDNQGSYFFQRLAMIRDVQAGNGVPHDGTIVAPSGGPITIDVEKWGAGSWVSIFSAPKDIVASGDGWGSVQPDGNYGRKCFTGATGATSYRDAVLRLNLDAVNNAEGFYFTVRFWEYLNPLEEFLAHNDFGV